MNQERQQDRIMHLLLSEGLARQTPPDLSDRIFARAFPEPSIATLATLEPEDYSLTLPRISTLPAPQPRLVPAELVPTAPPKKNARRPLIFRLARPLAAAAMLALVIGLLMYVNRPYPQPALAGDFTITGGGPVARGSEVVTTQKTARLVLGGSYQVELAPQTRLTINGLPHAEALALHDGQVVCDLANDLGDLTIKTEAGTITASDARFRATLENQTVSSGKGETNMMIHKKLLVAVFSGIVTVSGNWGQTSFAAGHEQAFTAAGPVTPAAVSTTPPSATTPPSTAATRIAGTIASVSTDAVTVQVSGGTTVSVSVTPNTSVKISDKAATLADLKTGMNVVIYITNTTTQIIASVPAAPKPPAPPATTNITGTLAAIADNQLTIKSSTSSTVVTLTAATVIKLNGNVVALADLKTGLSVLAITTDGKTATEIRAYTPTTPPTPAPPPVTTVGGTVSQIGNGQVTITDGGKNTVLTFTTSTTFNVNGVTATADAIKTGMHIYATTTDGKTAATIRAYNPTTPPTPTPTPPLITTVGGTVTQTGNGQVTITDGAKNTILTFTSSTTFNVNGVAANADALKTGMHIYATTTDNKTAATIRAYTPTTTPTPPAAVAVNGMVSQIAPNQITITDGAKVTVVTFTSATTFTINGVASGPTALKVGMHISASTTDGKAAKTVQAYTPATTTNTK